MFFSATIFDFLIIVFQSALESSRDSFEIFKNCLRARRAPGGRPDLENLPARRAPGEHENNHNFFQTFKNIFL